MTEIIDLYYKYKEEGDIYQYRMRELGGSDQLQKLSADFGSELPSQYIIFLEHFDGGYICNGHWGEYIWETGSDSLPKERSIYFYSASEVIDNASQVDSITNDDFKEDKAIPIAKAPNRSILIMKAKNQSAVYKAFVANGSWVVVPLYDDLKSLLRDYIENEGYIKRLF